MPEILNELNDLIDLANEISIRKNEEQIFTLALSLSLLKEKVAKEFIGDVE